MYWMKENNEHYEIFSYAFMVPENFWMPWSKAVGCNAFATYCYLDLCHPKICYLFHDILFAYVKSQYYSSTKLQKKKKKEFGSFSVSLPKIIFNGLGIFQSIVYKRNVSGSCTCLDHSGSLWRPEYDCTHMSLLLTYFSRHGDVRD